MLVSHKFVRVLAVDLLNILDIFINANDFLTLLVLYAFRAPRNYYNQQLALN